MRTWTVLALVATALATQAADAATIQGTRPPSRADRHGLVKAFDAVHRDRSHIRLMGFRVWENKPAGAAYSLVTDAQGAYVAGHTDLFRRTGGHRWVHTTHFKNENPMFNWASTLHPGYLYRVTSDGTGAYDEQSTRQYDDGSDTINDHLHADFRWHFDIDRGRALLPARDNFFYAPALTGSLSYTFTDAADPTQNQSCSGDLRDVKGEQDPAMSLDWYPDTGAKTQGWELVLRLANKLRWPDCGPSQAEPTEQQFFAGDRMPNGTFIEQRFENPMQGKSFDIPVSGTDPSVVKLVQPHTGDTSDDGTTTDSYAEDLGFTGSVHFRLVGMWMPLGLLSAPNPPIHADGHVPPVQR